MQRTIPSLRFVRQVRRREDSTDGSQSYSLGVLAASTSIVMGADAGDAVAAADVEAGRRTRLGLDPHPNQRNLGHVVVYSSPRRDSVLGDAAAFLARRSRTAPGAMRHRPLAGSSAAADQMAGERRRAQLVKYTERQERERADAAVSRMLVVVVGAGCTRLTMAVVVVASAGRWRSRSGTWRRRRPRSRTCWPPSPTTAPARSATSSGRRRRRAAVDDRPPDRCTAPPRPLGTWTSGR